MQASIYLPSPSSFLSMPSPKASSPIIRQHGQTSTSTSLSIKAKTKVKAAAASSDNSQVDYSSMASSVFPAEACETVGGVACDVEMFPETKMKQHVPLPNPKLAEAVDREYLDYNTPKTVFISEACDDLGGEFCDPAYQSGLD